MQSNLVFYVLYSTTTNTIQLNQQVSGDTLVDGENGSVIFYSAEAPHNATVKLVH